jgi:lactose/L-arabinose transport system substrate-binding protein
MKTKKTKYFFRIAALFLAAAIIFVTFQGCSEKETGNTLTVWCWDESFNVYAMRTAAEIFARDNPGFTLEIEHIWWDDLSTRLEEIAESGNYSELPDIFLVQNNAFQKYLIYAPDLFHDLTGKGIAYNQFPESVVARSMINGRNFGVPFDNGAAIQVLRTDILEQAGYKIEDFTDITWNEYMDKAEDVLNKTGKPLLSGIYGTGSTVGEIDMISIIMQSAASSLFDDFGVPFIANNDVLKKAIDVCTELITRGIFVGVPNWDEYLLTFKSGDVAGVINGCWILGEIQTTADQSGKWDVTTIPRLDNMPRATNYSSNGGSSWAVSSTANANLAIDFLSATFGGNIELYETILPSSGALANYLPMADSGIYNQPQEFFGGSPIYARIIDYAQKVPGNNTGVYYYDARNVVGEAIFNIIGGMGMDEALIEAEQKIKELMGL